MSAFAGIMIVSDCDGTLLNTNREIPDSNIQAIDYFINNGGKFAIATGRPRNGARHIMQELPQNIAPSVFFNGALIYDTKTEKPLHTDPLSIDPVSVVQKIRGLYPSKVGIEAFTLRQAYIIQDHPITRFHFQILHEPIRFISADKLMDEEILKLFVTGETSVLTNIQHALQAAFPDKLNVMLSGNTFLEIFSSSSSKGRAIGILRQLYPEIHKLCAVGDSFNDLSMLRKADLAFIPENGVDAAKATGTVVCSCDEGAVSNVIELLSELYH